MLGLLTDILLSRTAGYLLGGLFLASLILGIGAWYADGGLGPLVLGLISSAFAFVVRTILMSVTSGASRATDHFGRFGFVGLVLSVPILLLATLTIIGSILWSSGILGIM